MDSLFQVTANAPDCVVALFGKIDAANYEQIQSEVLKLIEQNEEIETFTFDVNEVSYVSSAGIRMFSAINKACKTNQISYKLTGLREDILKMFQLTGYSSVFKIEPKAM